MGSCEEALELISASLDGALNEEEQAVLDEHLSRCPPCSALFTELSGLHTAAAGLEEVSAPAGFADRVMAQIAADPVQEQPGKVVPLSKKKRSPWKGWAAAAAVVAVVALGAVTLPGRIGSAGSSTADCAAPSLAESAADAEYSPDEKADGFSGSIAAYSAPPADFNGTVSEPESALADAGGAEPQKAEVSAQFSDAVSPAAYCGVLTLTGESLPEGLEDYEATEDEQGNHTYVVPAEYFFSCLARLEEQDATGFTYDASEEEAAEYGLIVVEAP